MERKRIFRSGVVLIELMASILIFALAGAVCVRVLLKADETAAQARHLSEGVNYVSSAAEAICSAQTEADALWALEQVWPQYEDGVAVFENGTLAVAGQKDGSFCIYHIQWLVEGACIYELEVEHYYPEVAR